MCVCVCVCRTRLWLGHVSMNVCHSAECQIKERRSSTLQTRLHRDCKRPEASSTSCLTSSYALACISLVWVSIVQTWCNISPCKMFFQIDFPLDCSILLFFLAQVQPCVSVFTFMTEKLVCEVQTFNLCYSLNCLYAAGVLLFYYH